VEDGEPIDCLGQDSNSVIDSGSCAARLRSSCTIPRYAGKLRLCGNLRGTASIGAQFLSTECLAASATPPLRVWLDHGTIAGVRPAILAGTERHYQFTPTAQASSLFHSSLILQGHGPDCSQKDTLMKGPLPDHR